MKAHQRTSTAQKLTHEIQLARILLAKAESQRKSAKEQARRAKRRRKEAKEAARRARKQAKLAKRAVAEAKLLLTEAEKKLARAVKHEAAARGKKATKAAPSPSPKSVKPKKPKPGPSTPTPGSQPTDQMAQAVAPTGPAPASNQPPLRRANTNPAN